ncbi:DUF5372 family protein [Bordetella petrii]|uniref:Uncharacterized protein n=1 Tax=Bordetella petrii (strain ATCC BAA-461 / DSM 12804 / CCUG 43448 / CIP 107267 / Se-1111R) TaxID=340100 RepID=A9IEF5_BORPD|nr:MULTISPECIES: DUF5372 family protein [Pseudomonadota]CAP41742.1 conserved hypothetical protein [Bordetella petrii]
MRGVNWHEDRAFFHDCAGRVRSLPTSWTDLVAEDPFNAVAAGRAAFRLRELLDLVQLIGSLKP